MTSTTKSRYEDGEECLDAATALVRWFQSQSMDEPEALNTMIIVAAFLISHVSRGDRKHEKEGLRIMIKQIKKLLEAYRD